MSYGVMSYKGFTIKIDKHIDSVHPQYNYLGFIAEKDDKYINAVFRDIDMRIKSEEELKEIFIRKLDNFIKTMKE